MPTLPGPFNLATTFLRLRADLTAEPLTADQSFWPRLMSGELGTFHGEKLVTLLSFDKDWSNWERHPSGDEIVLLIAGRVTLVLELDGREHAVMLDAPGAYVLVPRNTWHTARTSAQCQMLFITPGEGTDHRSA
jgi:mannose-6-phosphate isomerase-like protein (cupin superfamily)